MAMDPEENWRTCRGKALLRSEIEAGTVDERSDPRVVHESNPWYKKWPFNRFSPNMKNLIKSVRKGGNAKPVKWAKSSAKLILKQAIIDGEVTEDVNPEELFNSRDEYKQYELANFKSNLKNLMKAIYSDMDRMANDRKYYEHDIVLLRAMRAHLPPRRTPWHKSEAKPLLENDIANGKHKTHKPKELYESKAAYREFTLAEFRDHIYQTRDKIEKQGMRWEKKKKRMKGPATIDVDTENRPMDGIF